jgi:flagellum-specific peptidoglycan hydrolase FlgJ
VPDAKTVTLIAEAAVACEKLTGVPAEISVAQCALESGWLQHAPGNNCFGIKAYAGCPARQLLHTMEWFTPSETQSFLAGAPGRTAVFATPLQIAAGGRHKYIVQDWFANFPTLKDCFIKHAMLFAGGKYEAKMDVYRHDRDLEGLVRGIAPIYATAPGYADSVLQIVRQKDVQDAIRIARG